MHAAAVSIPLLGVVSGRMARGSAPKSPQFAGSLVREFLVDYHQIQHETFDRERPFARLRLAVQAETAGVGATGDDIASACREFLTIGLPTLRRYLSRARMCRVRRGLLDHIGEEVDLVAGACDRVLDDRAVEHLGAGREALTHMEALATACLDAYLEVAARRPCEVEAEVRAVVRAKSSTPALRGVSIEVECDPGGARGVLFDPDALRAVVGELLENAGRALTGRNDPRIAVRVGPHPADPRFVHVEVADNGPGLSAGDGDAPFQDPAGARTSGGFGLPHAREIARSWLGDLEVHTLKHGGALAVLRLRVLAARPVSSDGHSPQRTGA
jgi:signal transduction histidine kinase